jgi:hypothetical protein
MAAWLHCLLAGWLAGWLAGCLAGWLAGWLHGCMAAWLHGCMAARLHGCMAAWLHGCTAAWLHGWLSSWHHTISWFTVLGVEKHQHACARASPTTTPPQNPAEFTPLPCISASAQHTAHSTQHTAHSTAQWFLGGKCLVLINTVFNASPTPSP